MSKGKYLSIDYGDKRVGIAVSDYNKEISFPRDFLTYTGTKNLIKITRDAKSGTYIIIGFVKNPFGKKGK